MDLELLFSVTKSPRERLERVDPAPCLGLGVLLYLPSPAQHFLHQGTRYRCTRKVVNNTRVPSSVKSVCLFLKLLVEIGTNGTQRSDTVGNVEVMLYWYLTKGPRELLCLFYST